MDNIVASIIPSGLTGMIIMIMYTSYKLIKKSSCRSKCCGVDSSFDIDLEHGLRSNSTN